MMNADQSLNAHRTFSEEAGNEMFLDDLIERVNIPCEEVRLSLADKLKISYGLQFLRLELGRDDCSAPD